jgi:hypothetical protein
MSDKWPTEDIDSLAALLKKYGAHKLILLARLTLPGPDAAPGGETMTPEQEIDRLMELADLYAVALLYAHEGSNGRGNRRASLARRVAIQAAREWHRSHPPRRQCDRDDSRRRVGEHCPGSGTG